MPKPFLKEWLLDGDDPEGGEELREVAKNDEADLQAAIKRWQLDYPTESSEKRAIRLANQHRIDRLVIVAYGIVVSISVLSCAIAMWFSASEVLTVLFVISFIQGPLVVYQRLGLMKATSKRDAIAALWGDAVSLRKENDRVESEIIAMQKDVERMKTTLSRYNDLIKGHDISGITALYHENESINQQKKQLAEAIAMEKLIKSILRTDTDRDHFVGSAELSLLAQRVESIEGVPFTSDEMCAKFELEEHQSLGTLADVVRNLYIEKRREQLATKRFDDKSPRKLGAPLLWKRKMEGIGVVV